LNVYSRHRRSIARTEKVVISFKRGNKEGNVTAGMEIDNARLNG